MTVTNLAELDGLVAKVKKAQEIYATFTQEQVDKIFFAAAKAASAARIPLAQHAVSETGMGVVEDKVIKNAFASEYILNKYRNDKTCGIIDEDTSLGTITYAEPFGVICAIIPTTNPTSTAIFKVLICLKTRNAIIITPHPRAKKATVEAAKIILDAAVAAGAPEDIIGWIDEPTLELTSSLMKHHDIAAILATGGSAMVTAAYSSGNPAIGVGAGNTPVIIDETSDLKRAISSILISKTFDNGMICASEQSVIVVDAVYDEVKKLFKEYGAYLLDENERQAVGKIILNDKGAINAEIVGQPAYKIAGLAHINVPTKAKILIGEIEEAIHSEPFAHEKLSPVLAMFKASNFEDALGIAKKLIDMGGLGHTSVLHTDQDKRRDRIEAFSQKMQTCRVLINQPASQGAIGDVYNFNLAPSLTLGCGSWGKNSVSENVGPKHLLNLKIVAKRAENMLCQHLPSSIIFRRGSLPIALNSIVEQGAKRVFIVTDKFLFDNGVAKSVLSRLQKYGLLCETFFEVEANPTLSTVQKGALEMAAFKPDTIIAVGGGSSMDASKLMWVLYEHPETNLEDLTLRFLDVSKRICRFPHMGKKAQLICVTTTSGTGSEVTPFAVVTDDKTGQKYPLADFAITPTMAIVDADLVMNMPQPLCAMGGYDAICHAVEAYVSVLANEFSDAYAIQALRLLKKYLPASYKEGVNNPIAREKVHSAATISGMAFAQAFSGICHSMAHKIGAAFNIPHGIANALLICNVIRYNATNNPTKQAAFSQYGYPQSISRYAQIADELNLAHVSDQDEVKVGKLIDWLQETKVELNIPISIQDYGVEEEDFLARVDQLALDAFDDQCTGANPRYPLVAELKQIMVDSYYGDAYLNKEE